MKQLIILLLFITGSQIISAQDVFQTELFSVETVLKYRSEIDLSEDKTTRIKKIYNDNISSFNTTKWDVDALQVNLNKLISESKVDEKTALAIMEEISELEQKLKRQRLKMLIKIKNQLTPPQQSKLKKLRKNDDISTFKLTTPISEDPRIVIRGSASKDGKTPMYIIIDKDGQKKFLNGEVQGGLLDISPNNIESVNVIKGKAAITKYGKEGKNGVVIIKLKE